MAWQFHQNCTKGKETIFKGNVRFFYERKDGMNVGHAKNNRMFVFFTVFLDLFHFLIEGRLTPLSSAYLAFAELTGTFY